MINTCYYIFYPATPKKVKLKVRLTNETWQERLRDLESEIYHRFVDHISKQVKKLIDHPLLQSLLCTGISPCECQL